MQYFSYRSRIGKTGQDYLAKLKIHCQWEPRSDTHNHPVCDVLRALAELKMYRLISDFYTTARIDIVEPGANILRSECACRNSPLCTRAAFRFVMPPLMPGDERRSIARLGRASCTHRLQDCDCPPGDIIVSTHMAYYLTPDEMAATILQHARHRDHWAIVHKIDDAYGSVAAGELTWRLHPDGLVRAAAANDNHTYVHPLNTWMFEGTIATPSGPLCIRREATIGDIFILRFYLPTHDVFVHRPLPNSWAAVVERGVSGDVTNLFTAASKELVSRVVTERVQLASTRCHSLFGVLMVDTTASTPAIIPRWLVQTLAAEAVGQARTPTLYHTLVSKAGRILRTSGCPSEIMADAITYAPVLAMLLNLEKETAFLGRGVATHGQLIAAHTAANEFRAPPAMRWWERLLVWCRPQCCAADFESAEAANFHPPGTTEIAALCRARLNPAPHVPAGVSGLVLPATEEIRAPPVAPPISTVRRGPNSRAPTDRPQMTAGGIVFGDHIPTYMAKTQEAGAAALEQRILVRNPNEPVPGAWAEIHSRRTDVRSILGQVVPDKIILNFSLFQRWAARYPENRRRALIAQWHVTQRDGLSRADMTVDMIIKLEKGGDMNAAKLTKPRAVFANRPPALVIGGPVYNEIGKQFRSAYDVADHGPYVWVNGCTGEEFGQHTDLILDLHPDWVAHCADQTTFEASKTADSCLSWSELVRRFCDHPLFQSFVDMDDDALVVSRHLDLSAKVENRLTSGRPKTSVLNLADNFAGVYSAFGEPTSAAPPDPFSLPRARLDLSSARYAANSNGDDSLVYGPRELLEGPAWDTGQRRLGFEAPGAVCHPWDAQFCRTRPWPSDRGTIWGVMIGRTLGRLGWFIDAGNPVHPAAVAKGLIGGNNHVPFVRLLLQRMIILDGDQHQAAATHEWSLRSGAPAEPTAETYAMLQHVYGLTKADEDDFGRLLAGVSKLPCMITWGHLAHCLAADE